MDSRKGQCEGMSDEAKAQVLGLQILCPVLNEAVVIPRENFAVGPADRLPDGHWITDCLCGQAHAIPGMDASEIAGRILVKLLDQGIDLGYEVSV